MVHYLDQPLDPKQAPFMLFFLSIWCWPRMAHVVPWEEGCAQRKKVDKQKPFEQSSSWDLFFIPILLGLILSKGIYGIFMKSDLFSSPNH